MRLRPTPLGWKGMLLMAALLLAFEAAAYSNLFFLLVAFGFVLGGLGAALAIANVRAVAALRADAPSAAADARRPVAVRAQCRRAVFDVDVALILPAGDAPVGRVTGAGDCELRADLAGRPRGIAIAAAARVRSTWPFGLFAVARTLPCHVELVTWPAPTQAPAPTAAAATARAGGREPAVAGVRPFRAGDAISDVDWKATARRGEPMTKDREIAADAPAVVVVDRRLPPAAFEHALAAATTAVLAHAHRGAPLRLCSQDCDLALAPRRSAAEPLLRWLAAATPLPVDAPPPGGPR